MKLLLDTHVFLWSLNGRSLSELARRVFLDIENELFLSAVSYWEICIKMSIGKLMLSADWPERFDAEMAANGIRWLPIEQTHCRQILTLPSIHQDPFDRLLVAQAIYEEMAIVTSNRNISLYPVTTVW